MKDVALGLAALALVSCAATVPAPAHERPPIAADPGDRCVHGVACETCVRCHPVLAARFKASGDWCPEHGVPESQCGICHPEVIVAAPKPPEGADVAWLATGGEDVAALDTKAVAGKVTIFDFYADWCGPCRRVDEHVFELLKTRRDLALRKLNIVSWETPMARRYLAGAPSLPYVIVFGRDGKSAGSMSGFHLDDLDRAIAAGSAR